MSARLYLLTTLCLLSATATFAADRFFGFNNTTNTVFTGVYLAPHGSSTWGTNEALNDKDKTWEAGERLAIKTVSRGLYDLKLIDQAGHVCLKPAIDLTNDTTFEIRDSDCKR